MALFNKKSVKEEEVKPVVSVADPQEVEEVPENAEEYEETTNPEEPINGGLISALTSIEERLQALESALFRIKGAI